MARLTVWVCLFVWLISRPALGAAPALHWVRAKGAEACIEPAALAERVEALTGTGFVAPAAAELSLEGLIEPKGQGFRVRIVSSRRNGPRSAERVLSSKGRDCRELDAAITFVIALTIDPGLSLAGLPADALSAFSQEFAPEQALLAEFAQESSTPTPSPASPPPAPKVVSAPRRESPPRATPPPRYGVGLAAAALSGSAPQWLGGVRANFGLLIGQRIALGLALSAFPSARAQAVHSERTAANERRAVFHSYDATLSACPALRWGRFRTLGCAGIALAYLRAQGRNFERNHTAALWEPSFALGLGVGVSLAGGFGLFASATMRVRFRSQAFRLSSDAGMRDAFSPARVAGLFSFGPSYEF